MNAGTPAVEPRPLSERSAAPGVSVVIPCYNGVRRLAPTLAHLAAQSVPPSIDWEVVLIDNASTDGTADFARQQWRTVKDMPLRVLPEPRPGAAHARVTGAGAARYEFIGFLDDDNWPEPDWVATLFQVLSEHPQVGACGGITRPALETPPPAWFARYQSQFAVGPQFECEGDITATRGYLWGAGLGLRRSAWRDLSEAGFAHYLPCRQGSRLSSGGDSELCFALRLAGWRLHYDPRLKITHFIPRRRLSADYLRRLHFGFGSASVFHHAYDVVLARSELDARAAWRKLARKAVRAFRRHLAGLARNVTNSESVFDSTVQLAHDFGKFAALIQRRREFERMLVELKELQRTLTGCRYAPSTASLAVPLDCEV